MSRRTLPLLLSLAVFAALAGCEQLGIDDPVKVAEKRDAEGRAVGAGCRHAGRQLDECYTENRKESKAAIFAGWREMDGYMRENKIDTATPVSGETEAEPAAKAADESGDADARKDKDTQDTKGARGKKVT
ncbi:MAG: hypothetical protein KJ787_07010 [Gammaproteobacteria bacterium]|nr:hypothetical protein [Gammaproteobacteria bacterium]MBU1646068.1 hypothetical protein [Gammaproteobacteria bacterium]MBU1972130.1 hypothetical protein [Gammaproteobacteria bacterium]